MSTLVIIGIIVVYVIIGRIFAQIYVNIEGWTPYCYDEDIWTNAIFWPIKLPFWLLSLLIEWINDRYF